MHLPPMQCLQVALALAAAEDLSAYDLRPEAVLHTGARILWLLAAVAAHKLGGLIRVGAIFEASIKIGQARANGAGQPGPRNELPVLP